MPRETDLSATPEGSTFGVPKRKEETIARLSEAYARNDLEQDEFERRLDLVERARTIEELDAVIADFPAEVRTPSTLAPVTGKELEQAVAELDGMSAPTRFTLIGDQHVTVAPGDPRVVRAVCVIGDTKVDLRPLSGQSGVFLLKVAALIGDTEITVPTGTEVQFRILSLIGDQSRGRRKDGFLARLARKLQGAPEKTEEMTRLPGPTVVVTGYKLIGDVKVVED